MSHAKRYQKLFFEAVKSFLKLEDRVLAEEDEPVDVLIQQRLELARMNSQQDANVYDGLPEKLLYRMYIYHATQIHLYSNVSFKPLTDMKPLAVREVKGDSLGQLVSMRGIVTRISDVKSSAVIICYTCSACNSEIFQEVKGESFMPLKECPTDICRNNNIKGELTLQTRASRFVRFQKARIQELVCV
jgi:DNA replication licensing factor MCM7